MAILIDNLSKRDLPKLCLFLTTELITYEKQGQWSHSSRNPWTIQLTRRAQRWSLVLETRLVGALEMLEAALHGWRKVLKNPSAAEIVQTQIIHTFYAKTARRTDRRTDRSGKVVRRTASVTDVTGRRRSGARISSGTMLKRTHLHSNLPVGILTRFYLFRLPGYGQYIYWLQSLDKLIADL